MRLRQGRVYRDLFTLELQHTPDMVTAIEDTNQVLASKKGTIYQEKGGVLDDPRAVIETASGTGDGVTVLVLLIMSVFFAACAALISGGVVAYLRSNTMTCNS